MIGKKVSVFLGDGTWLRRICPTLKKCVSAAQVLISAVVYSISRRKNSQLMLRRCRVMKKIGCVLAGIACVIFLMTASSAEAQRCGFGRGMGGCGWCGMGPNAFNPSWLPNLTQEQSGKLADMQKKHIEETSQLRTSLAVKGIELDQLLDQAQPNTEAVLAKQKEMSGLQTQLQEKCLRRQMDMRSLLTDEQRAALINRFDRDDDFYSGWMGGGPRQGKGSGRGRGYGGGGMGYCPCWW
jgi:Spy/CpxP family protein refolding chaperone